MSTACERSVSEAENGAERAERSDKRWAGVGKNARSSGRSGRLQSGNGAVSGLNLPLKPVVYCSVCTLQSSVRDNLFQTWISKYNTELDKQKQHINTKYNVNYCCKCQVYVNDYNDIDIQRMYILLLTITLPNLNLHLSRFCIVVSTTCVALVA